MFENAELKRLISAEARTRGTISFQRFMEMALYQPGLGYYINTSRPRVGRAGDFMTSVSAGAVFGRILAQQFRQFKAELGNPPDFQIIECGGHRGRLRDDVNAAAPDIPYRMIEAGEPMPDRITGCIFANELLDAFPVHRVHAQGGAWLEIHVTPDFDEVLKPIENERLRAALASLPAGHMEGYTTEINLRALDWIELAARSLARGCLMLIDYGFEWLDYYSPARRNGTLQCYHRHTRSADPYAHIGEQDITSHVEFTSVRESAAAVGFQEVLFEDQGRYLARAGEKIIEEIVTRSAGRPSAERNAVHQLIHPAHMGQRFHVLILAAKSAVA